MLDDFFIRALIAGIGVAIVTGPLGCFVVWRRLSYFEDEFGIEIDDEELADVSTVGQAVNLLHSKI